MSNLTSKSKFAITHHLFKLGSPNWGQGCKISWLISLLFWGLIRLDRSNLTSFKNPVYLHRFCVFKIFLGHKKQSLMHCSTSHMAPHICWFPYVSQMGHFMDREPVYHSETIGPSTRRFAGDFTSCYNTGGNCTMVAAATIVSMAAAKKVQQNVFDLYHSFNRTIFLGFIWIFDLHFKIVLVLRRRYLIPIRCNNGKRKMWPWHHFDFQRWRWLHALTTMVALFRAGNLWHTHSRSPADKCANRLYDCYQVWYV